MTKIAFRPASLSSENVTRLEMINRIIEEYKVQGYVLTLRQLYYQLVTREVIANNLNEYRKLSVLLVEGRMSGVVDWAAIEDRLRQAESPSSWNSPGEILDSCIHSYARPRQQGQPVYIEVWVEKDALSEVLSRVTSPYHIPIMVNRGYSSASAMFEAFGRFDQAFRNDQAIRILYLGDHDPSGLNMVEDIEGRILEFFFGSYFTQGKRKERVPPEEFRGRLADQGLDFEIIPVALTREQVNKHRPPPNPAKMADPRADKYVSEHGRKSWEVDALKPEILNRLLESAIAEHMDFNKYRKMLKAEIPDRVKLKKLRAQVD